MQKNKLFACQVGFFLFFFCFKLRNLIISNQNLVDINVYNLGVKQYGSQAVQHVCWGITCIKIVVNGHQAVNEFNHDDTSHVNFSPKSNAKKCMAFQISTCSR